MKSLKAWLLLLVMPLVYVSLLVSQQAPAVTPQSYAAQETCPDGGDWTKVDGLSSISYEYTVPVGKTVVQWCWKSANTVVYGTDGTPSTTTVTVTSTSKNNNGQVQNLSHASFRHEDVDPTPTPTDKPSPTPTGKPSPTPTDKPTPTPTITRRNFNLTSMCRIDEKTGQMRVRNNSGQPEKFRLYKVGGGYDKSGTAPVGDTLYPVPWTASNNTYKLEIGGFTYTKAIGMNPFCEEEPTPTPTEEPEPTPTPTQEPEVTPTPTPTDEPEKPTKREKDKISDLGVDPKCDDELFRVELHMEEDDEPAHNVFVEFEYKNQKQYAYSDKWGNARVHFKYSGDDTVYARPAQAFEHRRTEVTQPTDCGEVLGAAVGGQVLGAYAATGTAVDSLMVYSGMTGVLSLLGGLIWYGRRNNIQ